ncbi:MAG: hypothetical protein P4L22_01920 [Candidatus Babeliales bacterium]|nr:hypothetical protein [Candidatus Babeliales bacterium]
MLKNILVSVILLSVLASPVNTNCAKPIDQTVQEDSGLGLGLFALGAGVVGGLGLSNLFTSKSDSQIIEGSSNALDASHAYDEQIEILDKELDLNKLLKDCKSKVIVNTLDEEINYDLATNGISIDGNYINDLYTLISDLQFYQKKLPKRIKKLTYKLKRPKDYDKNLEMISQMERLLKSVDRVLPKLEFLKNYVKARLGYFEFYNIVTLTSEIYNNEIVNLEKYTEDKLAKELTRIARAKFSESSIYPCITYIKSVDNDTYAIQKSMKKLPKSYPDLHEDAQSLLDYLTIIRQSIISSPEYLQEKRDLYAAENPKTFVGLTYNVC